MHHKIEKKIGVICALGQAQGVPSIVEGRDRRIVFELSAQAF
jgi:hypothetical protein